MATDHETAKAYLTLLSGRKCSSIGFMVVLSLISCASIRMVDNDLARTFRTIRLYKMELALSTNTETKGEVSGVKLRT